jgi:hypothetical protein
MNFFKSIFNLKTVFIFVLLIEVLLFSIDLYYMYLGDFDTIATESFRFNLALAEITFGGLVVVLYSLVPKK